MSILEFRYSECPSCDCKDGIVLFNPETKQMIVNNQEQELVAEPGDEPNEYLFYGSCGTPYTEEGITIGFCEEPLCMKVSYIDGLPCKFDLECCHDDAFFVEYYQVVDGERIKISDSHDHPLIHFTPDGPVLVENTAKPIV